MSENRRVDSVGGVLQAIGVLAGLAQLFYRPFLLGPVGILIFLVGAGMSGKYRRFGLAGAVVITTCFVVGAAVAVWDSRPLY